MGGATETLAAPAERHRGGAGPRGMPCPFHSHPDVGWGQLGDPPLSWATPAGAAGVHEHKPRGFSEGRTSGFLFWEMGPCYPAQSKRGQ